MQRITVKKCACGGMLQVVTPITKIGLVSIGVSSCTKCGKTITHTAM